MKQAFFLVPIFVFLALLQTSFLAHFSIQGFVIPIVLIAVLIVSLFPVSLSVFLGVLAGSLVLDIFSEHVFGYWSLIAVLFFCIVSFFIHTYVRFPFLKRNY